MTLSTNHDGSRLLASNGRNELRVAHTINGRSPLVLDEPAERPFQIDKAVLADNGRHVFAAGMGFRQPELWMWDTQSGSVLFPLEFRGTPGMKTSSLDAFDALTELRKTLASTPIETISLAPNGSSVVLATSQALFSWESGSTTWQQHPRPPVAFHQLFYASDHKRLLTTSNDGSVFISVLVDDVGATQNGRGHTQPISQIFVLEKHDRVLSHAADGFRMWDVKTGRVTKTIDPLQLDGQLWTVALDDDAKRLAAGTDRGEIMVWDLEDEDERWSRQETASGSVEALAFLSEGTEMVTAHDNGLLLVWDLQKRVVRRTIELPSSSAAPSSLAYLADTHTLLVAGPGLSGILALPMSKNAAPTREYRTPEVSEHERLAVSPDGVSFAVTNGHAVEIWDVATGRRKHKVQGHARPIEGLTFSHNGTRLATVARDGVVQLWRTHPLEKLDSLDVMDVSTNSPTAIAFAADDRTLIVGMSDGLLVHWALP